MHDMHMIGCIKGHFSLSVCDGYAPKPYGSWFRSLLITKKTVKLKIAPPRVWKIVPGGAILSVWLAYSPFGVVCCWLSGVGAPGSFFMLPWHPWKAHLAGLNRESQVLSPSICSNRSGLMGLNNGSRIKSIPSRRASFAAGTKSLSPEISTIWSTCFL